MLTLGIFPTISVTTTLAGISDWSSPLITEFMPIVYIAIGVGVVGLAIRWAIGKFSNQ